MSIKSTSLTIECDEPGCNECVTFEVAPGKTAMECLRARGWQAWREYDYCFKHTKED